MKKFICMLSLLLWGTYLKAQDYNTAVGLRGVETSGLTIKKYTGPASAPEGVLGFWRHGISGTLLFERYMPAAKIRFKLVLRRRWSHRL